MKTRFSRTAAVLGVAAMAAAAVVTLPGSAQATNQAPAPCEASVAMSTTWPGGWIVLVDLESGATVVDDWNLSLVVPSGSTVTNTTVVNRPQPVAKPSATVKTNTSVNANVNTAFTNGVTTASPANAAFTKGVTTTTGYLVDGYAAVDDLPANTSTTVSVMGTGSTAPTSVICLCD
jgi:hypothetical protein